MILLSNGVLLDTFSCPFQFMKVAAMGKKIPISLPIAVLGFSVLLFTFIVH